MRGALSVAVPPLIAEMADWSPSRRSAVRREAADLIAARADLLMAPLPTTDAERWKRYQVFAALARGIAALAYQPGGVSVFGLHWCTNHDVCTVDGQGA